MKSPVKDIARAICELQSAACSTRVARSRPLAHENRQRWDEREPSKQQRIFQPQCSVLAFVSLPTCRALGLRRFTVRELPRSGAAQDLRALVPTNDSFLQTPQVFLDANCRLASVPPCPMNCAAIIGAPWFQEIRHDRGDFRWLDALCSKWRRCCSIRR